MAYCWVDIQVYIIYKTTHSSVHWYTDRLQIGINCWLMRHLLSTEASSNLPPSVLARNYHQAKPTVLSVVIGQELREVSIADYWDSYYLPTNQILTDLPPPVFARNYHQAQPTVLSVVIGLDVTKVSIADCWESYYRPDPPSIFHPLFLRGIITRHNPNFCPVE